MSRVTMPKNVEPRRLTQSACSTTPIAWLAFCLRQLRSWFRSGLRHVAVITTHPGKAEIACINLVESEHWATIRYSSLMEIVLAIPVLKISCESASTTLFTAHHSTTNQQL